MQNPTHHKKKSRRRLAALALGALVAAACFGANVGDEVYVGRWQLPIRNGKYAFSKAVATAAQGEKLTITGIEGKWYKVKYTPKGAEGSAPIEGYVLEDALSAREVAVTSTGGSAKATESGATGAVRGLI